MKRVKNEYIKRVCIEGMDVKGAIRVPLGEYKEVYEDYEAETVTEFYLSATGRKVYSIDFCIAFPFLYIWERENNEKSIEIIRALTGKGEGK